MKTNSFLLLGLCLSASITSMGQNSGRQHTTSIRQEQEQQAKLAVSHLPKPVQEAALRAANMVSRPGKEEKYQWDSTAWEHINTYSYTYNAAGNVSETLITSAGATQPSNRITDTYNTAGLLTLSVEEYWDNTQWVSNFRTVNTYDANGNLTLTEDQFMGSSGWETSFAERYTYTFNTAGHITQQIKEEQFNGIWENTEKTEYERAANGAYTELTFSIYDSLAWVPQTRQIDIVWEDFAAGRIEKYTSQNWETDTWENSERYAFAYGPNGSSTATIEAYVGPDTWMEMAKMYTTYDSHDNFTGLKYEINMGGTTQTMFEVKHLLTYDAQDNMTESVRQVSDFDSQTLVNDLRSVFSEFGPVSGVAENEKTNLHVYPNPASDKLQLTVTSGEKMQQVQLFDLTGRQVISQSVSGTSAQHITVELNNIPSGLYLLRTQTDKGISEQKVMKL